MGTSSSVTAILHKKHGSDGILNLSLQNKKSRIKSTYLGMNTEPSEA
jgi:hypothetical protein